MNEFARCAQRAREFDQERAVDAYLDALGLPARLAVNVTRTEGGAVKVMHVITGLNDGGAEAVLYRLVSHDQANTHHVVSLAGDGKYGPLLRQAGAEVTALGMPRGRVTLRGLKCLWRMVRGWRADVMQTWMYHADLLGGVAGWLTGVPVVWGIHHTTLERGRSSRTTIWVARLCARLSRRVPRRIVVCARAAEKVHAAMGYDAARMEVIPNGYDLSCFAPDASARQRLRAEWGVPDDVPVIGMVARFDPDKDHGNLIAALKVLCQKHAAFPFQTVLVGTGLDIQNVALVQDIAAAGLTGRVRLLGPRADVPAVMNALDLHVLSSAGEAFPNVLCEAMACGTPCVTTDVGDAALIVGDTGWVVPPRDAGSLATAISQALAERGDEAGWILRRQRCRQRIVDEFGIESMVRRYREVWESVAGQSIQSREMNESCVD